MLGSLGMNLESVLYTIPVLLTVISLIFMILLRDWWGLAVLLTLMLSRLLNTLVVRQRSRPGWFGAPEPGVQGDLLILLSQDRWIRLQGQVDALKTVTAGQWMHDPNFLESSLSAIGTLLVYIDAAIAANATQAGQIVLLALLMISVGLVALSNDLTKAFRMHGHSIRVKGPPKKYERRLKLAEELIEETGRDDWAIRLGMINPKKQEGSEENSLGTEKVIL